MEASKTKRLYDLTGLQAFFNEIETPSGLVEELTQLMFNYALTVDADSVDIFKEDLRRILYFRGALMEVE